MPRLHKYRNRNACYVLTAIRGAVVTYQLTPEGESKLSAAGIGCGQKFQRALLLDLYRSGDAYTGGSGAVEAVLVSQLELDFENDPDPETAFPGCDGCGSVNDLNLTISGSPDHLVAQLHCSSCRALPAARHDTSIPLPLLSRPILSRLFELKPAETKSSNVKRFEDLLRADFQSKWETFRKQRSTSQTSLFPSASNDGLQLSPD